MYLIPSRSLSIETSRSRIVISEAIEAPVPDWLIVLNEDRFAKLNHALRQDEIAECEVCAIEVGGFSQRFRVVTAEAVKQGATIQTSGGLQALPPPDWHGFADIYRHCPCSLIMSRERFVCGKWASVVKCVDTRAFERRRWKCPARLSLELAYDTVCDARHGFWVEWREGLLRRFVRQGQFHPSW